jgi:hypothetical protein
MKDASAPSAPISRTISSPAFRSMSQTADPPSLAGKAAAECPAEAAASSRHHHNIAGLHTVAGDTILRHHRSVLIRRRSSPGLIDHGKLALAPDFLGV